MSTATPFDVNSTPGSVRLYDLRAIDIGTVLSSLFAGAFLISRNLSALGDREGARNALLGGFLGLIPLALLAYSITLPGRYDSLVRLGFQLGQAAIIHLIAIRVHGNALREHKESGGVFFSRWRAAGLSILLIPVVFVVFLGVAILFPNMPAPGK
jgi:hypothetical protein